jgi:hypothetical protein
MSSILRSWSIYPYSTTGIHQAPIITITITATSRQASHPGRGAPHETGCIHLLISAAGIPHGRLMSAFLCSKVSTSRARILRHACPDRVLDHDGSITPLQRNCNVTLELILEFRVGEQADCWVEGATDGIEKHLSAVVHSAIRIHSNGLKFLVVLLRHLLIFFHPTLVLSGRYTSMSAFLSSS